MKIHRLGWSGLELISHEASIVLDHAHSSSLLRQFWTGGSPAPLLCTPALAALVTHMHDDHFDVRAIESAVGPSGTVLRPAPSVGSRAEAAFTVEQEADLAASSLEPRVVAEWESVELGPFTVTAVPAVDGLGDPQINWVVEADGVRIFHGGDTMFHGYWWSIARRLGPIDLAALPVNGAVVKVSHLQPPSGQPACLGPRDAVHAAAILQAKTLLPIHYGVVAPGLYEEDDQPLAHVQQLANEAGQRVVVLTPGQVLDVTGER